MTDCASPRAARPAARRAVDAEGFACLAVLAGLCVGFSLRMGLSCFLTTMMNTAYRLLTDTVFYLLAMAVLTGALSAVMMEFGAVSLLDRALAPLMRPLYRLPGAAVLGILTTYLSDNPAVLTLADDAGYRRYFRRCELPALTNLGTSFGMGLMITVFMLGLTGPAGEKYASAALVGNLGTVVGSVVSVRLMLRFSRRSVADPDACAGGADGGLPRDLRPVRSGGFGARLIGALMDGGRSGVQMGVSIIPGVLVICTAVMMLTYGPGPAGAYTGAANEGVAVLPWLGDKLRFLLGPLLGFDSASAVAVPVTALGSAGAAIGLIPGLLARGELTGDNIAVLTAMCMCWSGYLSTHVAMMDSLGYPALTGKAILSHTLGGLASGVAAHFLYMLLEQLT